MGVAIAGTADRDACGGVSPVTLEDRENRGA